MLNFYPEKYNFSTILKKAYANFTSHQSELSWMALNNKFSRFIKYQKCVVRKFPRVLLGNPEGFDIKP
jgi:hypothetical protein